MNRSCGLAVMVFACLIGWSGAVPRIQAVDAGGVINGIIWVANRGAHTIRAFDADTGAVVHTVSMAPNSAASASMRSAYPGQAPAARSANARSLTLSGMWSTVRAPSGA